LSTAASALTDPPKPNVPISEAIASLRSVQAAMTQGLAALDTSIKEVSKLNGYRLIGPLASAHKDLATQLPAARLQAARAEGALRAFLSFAGADGDRRYLLFSQNPDEIRPTGGFIGTFGVITANANGIALERYGSSDEWALDPAHAAAKVSSADAPVPFRIVSPPSNQLLLNSNATPDWPTDAKLAADMWVRGGEAPVDGVLSFTPDALARMLTVLGPVDVPDFNETVTAANLIERADFHTHQEPATSTAQRKRFISSVTGVVIQRLLHVPASKWVELSKVMAASFESRESLAWSSHTEVQSVLSEFGWDGAFTGAAGDFVGVSEFEFGAKNARALRRTYDHHVTLNANGSAKVDTTVTISNPSPFHPDYNINSLSYVVHYGPRGGVISDGTKTTDANESSLANQPAAAWLLAAPPGGQDTARVVWNVPGLLTRQPDGSMEYSLTWWHLPAHTGDVVNLKVDPPAGWRWKNASPPPLLPLNATYRHAWRLVRL
jgi:hypothetical protein